MDGGLPQRGVVARASPRRGDDRKDGFRRTRQPSGIADLVELVTDGSQQTDPLLDIFAAERLLAVVVLGRYRSGRYR
jgi:hypothetical protein